MLLKYLDDKFISDNRKDRCHYEILEEQVNYSLRDLTMILRAGKIIIAIDDGKI